MSNVQQMTVISEERIELGSGQNEVEKENVAISKVEAEVSELEEEQRKLEQIQKEVKQWMMSGSSRTNTSGFGHPTPQEKAEADSRSVYVGCVDYSVTVKELEAHFKGCGSMTRVSIQCDKFSGRPKGFAYIEFVDKQGAQNALEMSESLLKGRQIKVSPKRTNTPGISTSNRFPQGRGGFHGRARGGVIVKYVYPSGYNSRGRGMRRGVYSKYNIA